MLQKLENRDVFPCFRKVLDKTGYLVRDFHTALLHQLEGGNGGVRLGYLRSGPQGVCGGQQSGFRIGQAVTHHAGNVGAWTMASVMAGDFLLSMKS